MLCENTRQTKQIRMKRMVVFLMVSLALLCAACTQSPDNSDAFRRNIPCGIEVEEPGFATSDYTGIGGPGDFVAVFAEFNLSQTSVEQVRKGEIPFLTSLKCVKSRPRPPDNPRSYLDWTKTPGTLVSRSDGTEYGSLNEYLSRRDIVLHIPDALAADLHRSSSEPGNFIGRQNRGYLILSLSNNKAYYIFAN